MLFHAPGETDPQGLRPAGRQRRRGDGRAFEVDSNDGWLLSADGTREAALEHGSKT